MEIQVNYEKLITIKQMLEEGLAFTEGTLQHWIFNRKQNGLAFAVWKDKKGIMLDVPKFNIWLSLGKKSASDFRNFRTKEQILEKSKLKMGKIEHWLRNRFSNGLDEAVVSKGGGRLYIDVLKLNIWLLEQNTNPAFGVVELLGAP